MYSTLTKFKSRLKRDYNELYRDPDSGTVDDTLATADLTSASAEIDSYLAPRYVTPVTDADALPLLEHRAMTLAEGLAYLRSGGSGIPEKVKDRCDEVRKRMQEIAERKTCLPGTPAEKTTGAGGAAFTDVADPVFTRDKMKGW